MGRVWSFSDSWAIHEANAKLGDTPPEKLRIIKGPDGEPLYSRVGLDGVGGMDDGQWHYKGQPVKFLGESYDKHTGDVNVHFQVQREDGQSGGTYRVPWIKTAEGQRVLGEARRDRSF